MTILVSGSAASVMTVGAISGALAGTTAGLVIALSGKAVGVGIAGSAGGAIGTSASVGTVFGTVAGGGVASALAGGVAAVASSALVAASQAVLDGPIGWLIVGTMHEPQASVVCTYDCWKPVLHDDSAEPSNGRLLRDLAADPRIKQVITASIGDNGSLPEIIMENIWDERFCIKYVMLPSNEMSAHAVLLE
jgi:hypothetical protein